MKLVRSAFKQVKKVNKIFFFLLLTANFNYSGSFDGRHAIYDFK